MLFHYSDYKKPIALPIESISPTSTAINVRWERPEDSLTPEKYTVKYEVVLGCLDYRRCKSNPKHDPENTSDEKITLQDLNQGYRYKITITPDDQEDPKLSTTIRHETRTYVSYRGVSPPVHLK